MLRSSSTLPARDETDEIKDFRFTDTSWFPFKKNKDRKLIGTGGSAVCWIDHKTTSFDNLYRGKENGIPKISSERTRNRQEKYCLGENTRSGLSAPPIGGARFAYADETIDFRRVLSRTSHVIQKTADTPVPIKIPRDAIWILYVIDQVSAKEPNKVENESFEEDTSSTTTSPVRAHHAD